MLHFVGGKVTPETGEVSTRKLLSREAIAEAACDLLDKAGFENFSLRRLAAELDVHVTTLRPYYKTKADLLQAVFHFIHDQLEHEQDPSAPWQQHLRTSMRSFKQLLIRHPYLPMLGPYSVVEVALSHIEKELAALARGGFSPAEAARAFDTVRLFVIGCAIAELKGSPTQDARFDNRSTEARAAFPHLTDAGQYFQNRQDIFEFGLRGLLEFIEQEHQQAICSD